jgi:hypothetical protein
MANLLHEITETKERAWAWAFRGLSMIVMILLGIIGYFMTSTLQRVDASIDQNRKDLWKSVSTLNDSGTNMKQSIMTLSTLVQDEFRQQDDTNARLSKIEDDHETRLRSLEHPPAK